jgi:hypothetical protein
MSQPPPASSGGTDPPQAHPLSNPPSQSSQSLSTPPSQSQAAQSGHEAEQSQPGHESQPGLGSQPPRGSQPADSQQVQGSQPKVWSLTDATMRVIGHGKKKPTDQFMVIQLEFTFKVEPGKKIKVDKNIY